MRLISHRQRKSAEVFVDPQKTQAFLELSQDSGFLLLVGLLLCVFNSPCRQMLLSTVTDGIKHERGFLAR
jgi:hypothetical protein